MEKVDPSLSITLEHKYLYVYSPSCSLYISYGADKENLFNNQELLKFVIISFILVTLIIDSGDNTVERK